MSSVREIIGAIEKLPPDDFLKVQARMDRIAERIWKKEQRRVSLKFRRAGLSDEDIDQWVSRRRYRERGR